MKTRIYGLRLIVLTIFSLTVMFGAFGTAGVSANEACKHVIVEKVGNEIYEDTIDCESLPKSLGSAGYNMEYQWPGFQLLTIDGKPWQESEYAQIVVDNLLYYEGTRFDDPVLFEIFMNPALNGKGKEAYAFYKQGKSASEIASLLADKPQTGEPKKPAEGQQPAPDQPAVDENILKSKENAIVLTMNKETYLVYQNGKYTTKTLDAPPVLDQQTTLVPLRGVLEHFGVRVDWEAATNTIKATSSDKEIILTIGSRAALINGETHSLSVPAKLVNGRTMIPLRFVSEGFDLQVDWGGGNQSIIVH